MGIDRKFDISAGLQNYIGELTTEWPSYLFDFINTSMILVHSVIFIFMIPIITFYLLRDWGKLEDSCRVVLQKVTSEAVVDIVKDINKKLASYVKGQLLVCCILSVLYTVGLFMLGINEYFICGFFSGFLSFAPFFGPVVGLLTALSSAIDDFSYMHQYVLVGCLYVFIPVVDSNIITPKLIGRSVGIQPVWLLFSICASVSVLGIGGVFISIPVAIIMSVICKEAVKKIYQFNK
jgi:predicted PurR-regulated permease PerM